MTGLILAVVLYGAALVVVLGAVYGVVVLVVRSAAPRDRWRQAESGLTRPARGVIYRLNRADRGGKEDLTDE